MVNREVVEQQLRRLGCNFQLWGRGEANELHNVLMQGENLAHCVNGHYAGGFAMLCATDHRVLLIDKKPMSYLHVEDVRLEMISEFDYSHRLLNATVHVYATNKTMTFTSWNHHQLRALLSFVQQRVIEIRQYYYLAQQFQAAGSREQLQQSAYMPSLVFQTPGGSQPASSRLSDASRALGVYTYSKLPHLRRRGSRHLGKYAVPDEIYPAGEARQPRLF